MRQRELQETLKPYLSVYVHTIGDREDIYTEVLKYVSRRVTEEVLTDVMWEVMDRLAAGIIMSHPSYLHTGEPIELSGYPEN